MVECDVFIVLWDVVRLLVVRGSSSGGDVCWLGCGAVG